MRTTLSIVLMIALFGCSKKDDAPPPAAKAPPPPAAKTPPTPPPAAATPPDAAPAPAADALVEHDLSPQGAAWAGWTAKAPADGALESNDGTIKGGIAIRWGNGAGAMGFSLKKLDFKSVKHDLEVQGDTKVDKETADEVDATMTMMGTPLECFYQNKTIAGAQVGCWTVTCVPTDDAAGLAQAHAICDSLAKK